MKTIHELIMNLPGITGAQVAVTIAIDIFVFIVLVMCSVWIVRLKHKVRWDAEVIEKLGSKVNEYGNNVSVLQLLLGKREADLTLQKTTYEARIKALNEKVKQATDHNRNAALDLAVRHHQDVSKAKEYYRFLQGKL